MSIQTKLEKWDGKSADYLQRVYGVYEAQADFIEQIIELSAIPRFEVSASWLVKHHLENGGLLNETQTSKLLDALCRSVAWQASLHLLQCLDRVHISKTNRPKIEVRLRRNLTHENKFVRAWSYSGLARLASLFEELQDEVRRLLDMGLRDEPASVKARIRQAMTRNDYLR